MRRRSKAYKDYTEDVHLAHNKQMIRNVDFKVFFEDGDWSVKTYPNNQVINITHKHKNGTTYVIPFRYCVTTNKGHDTEVCDYGCHVCHKKAPESVVVVWKLLSFDTWGTR